jgi:hypothetical protein
LSHSTSLFFFFIPILLTSPLLFSFPYSYSLHFPSFSCATIYCSPSQLLLLFLHLLIYSFPHLQLHLLFTPNLSPHYPYLLHTHHSLTSLLHQLYTTPDPAIPDTLHYNNRNTPKHTQWPQSLAAPVLLPPLFSTTLTNSPKSITNTTNITYLNSHCL